MLFQSLGGEDPLEQEIAIHSSILPGKSRGQRSLVDCSPWDCIESDMTENAHNKMKQVMPKCLMVVTMFLPSQNEEGDGKMGGCEILQNRKQQEERKGGLLKSDRVFFSCPLVSEGHWIKGQSMRMLKSFPYSVGPPHQVLHSQISANLMDTEGWRTACVESWPLSSDTLKQEASTFVGLRFMRQGGERTQSLVLSSCLFFFKFIFCSFLFCIGGIAD